MIGEATLPPRYTARPASSYARVAVSASTNTSAYQSELDELLTLENQDGYTFQANFLAHLHASIYLEAATAILGVDFPAPEFAPDGEAGIDIEWRKNSRRVSLSCRGSQTQNDYIYWEENNTYDAKDFSLGLLISKLNWLNDA